MRWIWISLGLTCLGIGAAGTVLPLVPTTPLLLLAAFCFARSSERLHDWLVAHPTLGPPITDWRRERAIRRSAKVLASVAVAGAMAASLMFGAGALVLGVQAAVLVGVLAFVWSRPEPGKGEP